MHNNQIKSLIDKLNKNKTGGLIHLRPLTETVDFAKVFLTMPKPTDSIFYGNDFECFYFIKNNVGVYVAAVCDMKHDLHWYVDKKFRGQGHLTKAMKQIILFHLFNDREIQKITINIDRIGKKNFDSSSKVALSLGFEETGFYNYTLKREKYFMEEIIEGQNTPFDKKRMEELKNKIFFLSRSLLLIHTEFDMKMGYTVFAEDLLWLVTEIKKYAELFEDSWWKNRSEQN